MCECRAPLKATKRYFGVSNDPCEVSGIIACCFPELIKVSQKCQLQLGNVQFENLDVNISRIWLENLFNKQNCWIWSFVHQLCTISTSSSVTFWLIWTQIYTSRRYRAIFTSTIFTTSKLVYSGVFELSPLKTAACCVSKQRCLEW